MKYAGALPREFGSYLFFLSGCAALVYETVWIRQLSRLVGSDAAAMALVLAVFMGSLGLGAAALRGWVERAEQPVRLYVQIELLVAFWAAGSGQVLGKLNPLQDPAARVLIAIFLLGVPALLMGASFPLMGRLTIASPSSTATATSSFYGANTLGAALGALLAPTLVMPCFGLSGSLVCAGVVDLVVAASAPFVFRVRPVVPTRPVGPGRPDDHSLPGGHLGRRKNQSAVLWIAGCCGFFGLGLEVILSRWLVSLLGASVYSYALVLHIFLLGIALGSFAYPRIAARFSHLGPRDFLNLLSCALAPAALVGVLLVLYVAGSAAHLAAPLNLPHQQHALVFWARRAVLCLAALLPVAFLLGAVLPGCVAALGTSSSPETALSRVYASNTLGSLLGASVSGFFLLPQWGLTGALLLLCTLPVAVTLVGAKRWSWTGTGLAVFLGVALFVWQKRAASRHLIYASSDAHSNVSVEEFSTSQGRPARSLRVNGKSVASSLATDRRVQALLGYLPLALHPEARDVLVVGLGTGMTAGSLLDGEAVRRVDVFEISASMAGATRFFSAYNGALLTDDRVRVSVVDGKHALEVSSQRWDVITADPVHPWTRGSSDLFSVEHFAAMAAHLAPGGLASQWLPLYQLTEADVRTVLATWESAFVDSSAWLTGHDLVLLGAQSPRDWRELRIEGRLRPAAEIRLSELGAACADALRILLVADHDALVRYARGAPIMVDDWPILEYRAPLSVGSGYTVPTLLWATRKQAVAQLPHFLKSGALDYRLAVRSFALAPLTTPTRSAARLGQELLELGNAVCSRPQR